MRRWGVVITLMTLTAVAVVLLLIRIFQSTDLIPSGSPIELVLNHTTDGPESEMSVVLNGKTSWAAPLSEAVVVAGTAERVELPGFEQNADATGPFVELELKAAEVGLVVTDVVCEAPATADLFADRSGSYRVGIDAEVSLPDEVRCTVSSVQLEPAVVRVTNKARGGSDVSASLLVFNARTAAPITATIAPRHTREMFVTPGRVRLRVSDAAVELAGCRDIQDLQEGQLIDCSLVDAE